MNYIELSGPVLGTQGNITLIETNNLAVVTAAIAFSNVLNATTTTTSSSFEPIAVVFTEMENYLRNNHNISGYRVTIQGKRLEW